MIAALFRTGGGIATSLHRDLLKGGFLIMKDYPFLVEDVTSALAEKGTAITKQIARYAEQGLGYAMWRPGERGLPEFWFSSFRQLCEFAQDCGWALRRLG